MSNVVICNGGDFKAIWPIPTVSLVPKQSYQQITHYDTMTFFNTKGAVLKYVYIQVDKVDEVRSEEKKKELEKAE